MKKIAALALALCLIPTLAGAQELCSITELREQANAMGARWTKAYEAHGRTIEVDIPIVIPEVDTCPVATVQAYHSPVRDRLQALRDRADTRNAEEFTYTLTGEEEGASDKSEQTLMGLPIARSVNRGLGNSLFVLYDGEACLKPDCYIKIIDENNFFILYVGLVDIREVKYEDVPLASLEDIIAAIETEIKAGTIRGVYDLRLNYVLCRDSYGDGWVYPCWMVDCVYVEDPDAELTEDFGPVGEKYYEIVEFGTHPILAQNAEFISPRTIDDVFHTDDGQYFDLPAVMTWEEVSR